MSRFHILVADDDVQMVEIAKIILENAGYFVSYTYDSDEVIKIAEKENPNLIILDVLFAGMDEKATDGFEIYE